MGAPFIDYLITDRYVTPLEEQVNFDEKLVYLPHCYQPNDSERQIASAAPTRAECDLPEDALVLCCFNQSYKITPRMFDVWCRLLKEVPDSVLWLGIREPIAQDNLRREAQLRGVHVGRIMFAQWVATPADHIARLRNADLFLDTTPFNAHTTASDTLWAGVPLLTCSGKTYASRVAGSLLHAIGLAGLVTPTFEEYEALALSLMRDRARLSDLRRQLAHNKTTSPLFDSTYYVSHLETAYELMAEIGRSGKPPSMIQVRV
jgi:predicted O-linked N-acetylglucosamine transferase (SPINDLY family)